MAKRYVAIWFPWLLTDAYTHAQPGCAAMPVAVAATEKGRMKIKGTNSVANQKGIQQGMVLADCRAILPELEVIAYEENKETLLLEELALWCLRYTPVVATNSSDGLLLDVSGCTHLWKTEENYLQDISSKLAAKGFAARIAMADTTGLAWAAARHYNSPAIINTADTMAALLTLPPAALRLEPAIKERLEKLGMHRIADFINMPRPSLRQRFGADILRQIDYATGREQEHLRPVITPAIYIERLPCLEPVSTATAIEIAIKKLLSALCKRLLNDEKGLRTVVLQCFRIDGKVQCISVGTHQPARSTEHLFKLLELKIPTIEPALGIDLFTLEAPTVEDMPVAQGSLWGNSTQEEKALMELLDRIGEKIGHENIHRYIPQAHYWPERAMKTAISLQEKLPMSWPDQKPRPVQLLKEPELIDVAVPIPDYPPLLFTHQGKIHKIVKADGPERIEQEWWLEESKHRDYYCVEDEDGGRYWLFRLGHYTNNDEENPQWFLHGFFA